jgi:hypothetical protein
MYPPFILLFSPLTVVLFTHVTMSQGQHSEFASSLYDVEFDNSAYLTPTNYPTTPSGSHQTFDALENSFLRPSVPLIAPSTLERVGPDRRRLYLLYNEMSHSDWVEWWLQTDYGSKSKISWDSNHLSDV